MGKKIPKLYRTDGRTVVMLEKDGFRSYGIKTAAEGRTYLEKAYLGKKATKNLAGHIWGTGGDPKCVSTGTDSTAGGQSGGKVAKEGHIQWKYKPIYIITTSGFEERALTKDVLGFEPKTFSGKEKAPMLYMNAPKLRNADLFGLRFSKFSKEITMFSPIPFKYINDIYELGTVGDFEKKVHCALTGYKGIKFKTLTAKKQCSC